MYNFLILRTLTSSYGDYTKGSVLSQSELDGNFIFLKGETIYTAQTSGNVVTLKKYNGNDLSFNIGSGGTGTTTYFTVTKAQADALITGNTLTEGAFYKITGVHPSLYGGTDIILQATSSNTLSKRGLGVFYNPKYADYDVWDNIDKLSYTAKTGQFSVGESLIGNGGQTGVLAALPGVSSITLYQNTGNWTTATRLTGTTTGSIMDITGYTIHTTYSAGTKVIWGGKVWENLNGNVGVSTDMFTLNGEWSGVTYNQVDYDLVADIIEYQYEYDWISYRKANYNEVNYVWEVFGGGPYPSSIACFPWGNSVYLTKINNAFLFDLDIEKRNLLNFNGGSISFLEIGDISLFSVDYWGDKSGNNPNFGNIKIGNSCVFSGCSFGDQVITEDIFLENSSSVTNINIANNDNLTRQGIRSIKMNNGFTNEYPLVNTCYISNINIHSNAFIDNLEIGSGTETNGSYFENVTLFDGGQINNLKLDDSSYFADVYSSGIISNVNLGQSTYISNLILDATSVFDMIILKGAPFNNTPYSYIDNVNLVDSTLSGFEIGFSSYVSNINLNESAFYSVKLGDICYVDSLTASTSQIFNVHMKGGSSFSPTESYISNIILNNQCSLGGLSLGAFSKVDSISLNDNDTCYSIELGDFNIMSGITFTGTSSFFGQITTGANSNIVDIAIGDSSNITKISLDNSCELFNISMGDSCSFDTMTLKTDSFFHDIVLENNSSLTYFELGVNSEVSNIYMPTGFILSDVTIGGPLSLIGFTGSSLTSQYGYIIDHDNNNFPAELDITGLSTIDLSSVYYAGKVKLLTSNPSETITNISNSEYFYPVEFSVNTGSSVTFSATPVASLSNNTQFINSVSSVTISGDTYDYAVIKNIKNTYLQVVNVKNNI